MLPEQVQQSQRPQQPQSGGVSAPMVYVYERQRWEYKVVARSPEAEEPLSERELNELGASGWELAGVIALTGSVRFYFKRLRK